MTGGFGADSPAAPGATTPARARWPGSARAGFDWVCLDAQHGLYGRSELIEVARCFPFDAAELVVRVAVDDFAGIGSALDVGRDVGDRAAD